MCESWEIEHWIDERFPEDSNWTSGNCFFFAIILHAAFPGGDIVYDPIEGHFLYLYNSKFYDYNGRHEEPETWYFWDHYAEVDESHWRHVMRDCVGGHWAHGILESYTE